MQSCRNGPAPHKSVMKTHRRMRDVFSMACSGFSTVPHLPNPNLEFRTFSTLTCTKSQMHGGGESYSGIVPAERSNERLGGPKEIAERRPLTKENTEQP